MKSSIKSLWNRWLHQKMQWIPTLTLFLFLYPAGWIISHFVYLFDSDISSNNLSIIGTIITFIFFLIVLPSWARVRWKTNNVWAYIGLDFNNIFQVFHFIGCTVVLYYLQ